MQGIDFWSHKMDNILPTDALLLSKIIRISRIAVWCEEDFWLISLSHVLIEGMCLYSFICFSNTKYLNVSLNFTEVPQVHLTKNYLMASADFNNLATHQVPA